VRMIEKILTAAVEAALLAAFALIVGAFTVLLWDLLQERRMRGGLRVMVVVVLAPACALAAAVISAGVRLALASALGPDEPPAHTEPAEEDLERTSAAEGRGSETTTERRASPSATPSVSPPASPPPSPTATASPSASPSP